MAKNLKIIYLFIFVLNVGCHPDDNKSTEIIRFSNSIEDFYASPTFPKHSYNLITLETSKDSKFYRADCSHIDESNILLYDDESKKLLLFDILGNFKAKFYENVMPHIKNCLIKGVGIINDKVFVFDNSTQKIYSFSMEGRLINANSFYEIFTSLHVFDDRLFLFDSSPFYNKTYPYVLAEIDINTLQYKDRFMDKKRNKYKGIEGYRYAGIYFSTDTICYWNGYRNEIAKLDNNGKVSKIVRFDFHDKGVPIKIFNSNNDFRISHLDYLSFSRVMEDNNYIYIEGIDEHKLCHFVFDKSSDLFIDFNKGIPIEEKIDFGFWPVNKTNAGNLYNFYSLSDFYFLNNTPDSTLLSTQFGILKSMSSVPNPVVIILQKEL